MPRPPWLRVETAFLDGEALHASDGRILYRLEGDQWTPVAHLQQPFRFEKIVADKGKLWGQAEGALYKLVEGPKAEARLGCATPFVYAGWMPSSKGPEFQAMKKAFESFPWASRVQMRHFEHQGFSHAGFQVPSRAHGEALVGHLKAHLKDVDPRLTCFVPTKPAEESP